MLIGIGEGPGVFAGLRESRFFAALRMTTLGGQNDILGDQNDNLGAQNDGGARNDGLGGHKGDLGGQNDYWGAESRFFAALRMTTLGDENDGGCAE
jgi:hypothetical protein